MNLDDCSCCKFVCGSKVAITSRRRRTKFAVRKTAQGWTNRRPQTGNRIYVYSLPGKYMSQKYFTCPSVQIFKILFGGFYSQKSNKNLIVRTRPCGNAFINQNSWLIHFHETEICLFEMICTTVVPASKGHLGGASPQIFLHDS